MMDLEFIEECDSEPMESKKSDKEGKNEQKSLHLETTLDSRIHSFLLNPGSKFQGIQRVSETTPYSECWKVVINFEYADFNNAMVSGSMTAGDVPKVKTNIATFFEVEIIDGVNNFFRTGRYDASAETDLTHWSRFEGFQQFRDDFIHRTVSHKDLLASQYVFMRLKEKLFLKNDEDAMLTIQGFYYVCLDRNTHELTGYYFDPLATPFQKLELKWLEKLSFPSYDLR